MLDGCSQFQYISFVPVLGCGKKISDHVELSDLAKYWVGNELQACSVTRARLREFIVLHLTSQE